MVSQNLGQAHLLKMGLAQIPGGHEPVSIIGRHVDFASMMSSLGISAFTFICEVKLDGLRPFDQRELLDYSGHGPSTLCVKWP